MKTYRISSLTFVIVTLLIMVLPVSRKWRLILHGKKATGVVSVYKPVVRKNADDAKTLDYASEIRFRAGDSLHVALGPLGLKYKRGRTVGVLYDPDDPGRNCILTFTGLYLSDYSALPLLLLILWGAFYLSFNNYSKFARGADPGTPSGSPRLPPRRRPFWSRFIRR